MTDSPQDSSSEDHLITPLDVQPLVYLLGQIRIVVAPLTLDQYQAKPVATQCGAIGGHVRHILDHVLSWLDAIGNETLNYDDRQRETIIEFTPSKAVEAIDDAVAKLRGIDQSQLGENVTVWTMLSHDGPLVKLGSTYAREFAFVFSHTVHHNAIIGTIARALSLEIPDDFGVAPSTLAYRKCD